MARYITKDLITVLIESDIVTDCLDPSGYVGSEDGELRFAETSDATLEGSGQKIPIP